MVVSVVVLLAAGTALADDPQVVFDPTQTTNILGFNLVFQTGTTYDVSWTGCGIAQLINYSAFKNSTACLYFVNLTGAPITDLSFAFNDTGFTGSFGCTSADGLLTSNNCPETITAGNEITVDFFGGSPVPYTFPIPTVFIVGLAGDATGPPITPDVANQSFAAATTANVPTYDPGTLILLLGGVAMLALAGARRLALPAPAR
jgi:hypothetical protein